MNASSTAWWDFGYYGVFGCVFLEQMGVPIPAFPALIAAGALVASGELNLLVCLGTALAAALLADTIWFRIGRARGGAVLMLICKLSWRPDTCVSKTKTLFAQHGPRTLLVAKWITGLSTVASPLAGMSGVPYRVFLAYDVAGILLWALAPLLAGLYLQHSLPTMEAGLYSLTPYLPWACGVIIIGVLIWRYVNRWRYLHRLEESLRNGVQPADLRSLLDQGEELVVVDVRPDSDLAHKPHHIPQTLRVPYTTLPRRLADIPLDKRIVTYCACPRDQAAVAVADLLTRAGAKDAKPLVGGLEGWMGKGFATEGVLPGNL